MSEKLLKVEIPDGKYCRTEKKACIFYWESEDGDTGCNFLKRQAFIEGDISEVPKFDNCPSGEVAPAPPDEGIREKVAHKLSDFYYERGLFEAQYKTKKQFDENIADLMENQADQIHSLTASHYTEKIKELEIEKQMQSEEFYSKLHQAEQETARKVFTEIESRMEIIGGFWNVYKLTLIDDDWQSLKSKYGVSK